MLYVVHYNQVLVYLVDHMIKFLSFILLSLVSLHGVY